MLIRSIANVFARKQLNYLPAIDLERDMVAAINTLIPEWEFGIFQDIDEFLKAIFMFFPESVSSEIGYVSRDQISTEDGSYLVNRGLVIRHPMVQVVLPLGSVAGLSLQDLVNQALSYGTVCDYTMKYDEHPGYFTAHGIEFPTITAATTIITEPKVSAYADVVPVFIARRNHITSSGSRRDYRDDKIVVPELITFPLENGQSAQFTLVSFAVYHPGHYLTYSKSFPSREWFCYNDESVTKPTTAEVVNELTKHAVMLFYVRRGRSVETPIPEAVNNLAVFSMAIQHMRDRLVPRIQKMVKHSIKKKNK